MRSFRGSGGGGGGGSSSNSAHMQADTLRSLDTYETIIAIGEGPIEGLENGDQSIYLGDTPLQDTSGGYNFVNVSRTFYEGDAAPAYTVVPALGGFASSTSVGTQLYHETPVTRTTTKGDMDYLDFRVVFNQLFTEDSNGTYTTNMVFSLLIKPHTATYWCDYNQVGAIVASLSTTATQTTTPRAGSQISGYLYDATSVATGWDALCASLSLQTLTIGGKTSSSYTKNFRVPVLATNGLWDLQVIKHSVNTDGVHNFYDMTWESFQEITAKGVWTFPNTAILQLRGSASNQFTSLPQFSGIWKGRKVKVPTNYDPIAKTYSGTWDGTFKIAWTDNPAWCLYDFVTNTTYGASSYLPINMDKWTTYEAAQWCDERVPDGSPRYTFNMEISDPRGIKDQMTYMAGAFNAVFFSDQNGTMYLKVDKDEIASTLFSKENVTIEGFNYSFTDITTRCNDITVSFTNPQLNWQTDRRRVFNQDYINANGRVQLNFIAVGCTNDAEAIRRAQYKLITANTETMLVTFKTNRQSIGVAPYDIILISDPDLGFGLSGRIKTLDVTRTIIGLRDPLYLEAGATYGIQVQTTTGLTDIPLSANITGYNYSLSLSSALPTNIDTNAVFTVYQTNGVAGLPMPFRVLKISEPDGSSDNVEIQAIQVNRNKWYEADSLTTQPAIVYSSLRDPLVVPGPTSVAFTETFDKINKSFQLTVEPTLDRGAYNYYSNAFEVWSRPVGVGSYEQRTLIHGDTIINHPGGLYEFKVLPLSTVGGVADINSVQSFQYNVVNASNIPGDVTWLNLTNSNWLNWSYPDPPIDFLGFELRYNYGGSKNWDTGLTATPGSLISAPPFSLGVLPVGVTTLMLKAVDFFGNYSQNAAVVTVNLGDAKVANVVETFDLKAAGFLGNLSNGAIAAGDLTTIVAPGSTFYSGTASKQKYTSTLTDTFYTTPNLQLDYIDKFKTSVPGYMSVSYTITGGPYQMYYREYGEAGFYSSRTSMYTGIGSAYMFVQNPWLPLVQRSWLAAGEYEIKLTIPAGDVTTTVSALSVVVDVDDVTESIGDTSIASSGTRLPIKKTYTSITVVNLTLQDDGGTAYTAKVVDKNPTLGPLVKVLDITGAATTGLVDAYIEGY